MESLAEGHLRIIWVSGYLGIWFKGHQIGASHSHEASIGKRALPVGHGMPGAEIKD
jgi:hypothetical protein